jgi:DNA-binding transcriptional regulator YiaG
MTDNVTSQRPTGDQIRKLRLKSGLTQVEFGRLLHVNGNTVWKWEAENRQMHPAFWELARIKISNITL